MFNFEGATALHQKFVAFFEAGKVAAALCHGVAILSRSGVQGVVRHDRYKLGAKAVAPVEATQSTERQGRGWQEFGWHRRSAR